jgi:NADPH:quinone reductase-like Zn-dependent oxidoreductase
MPSLFAQVGAAVQTQAGGGLIERPRDPAVPPARSAPKRTNVNVIHTSRIADDMARVHMSKRALRRKRAASSVLIRDQEVAVMSNDDATTMKALTQDRYGSADVLQVRDIERPSAGDGQVLVRVIAAGMDRGAWHFMTGEPYLMRLLGFGFRAPKVAVPGTSFAGVVEAIGHGVTGYQPGDEVYGATRGTFAEYAVAPTGKIAPKPPQISFEQASVLPYPTFVALQALRDRGHVQPGQRVLVVGASGAVGTVAVQLAVAFGADVTGVCSSGHTDLVRSLGAKDVIDYTTQDFADGSRHFDLILDIGGRTPVVRLRRALSRSGTLVILGGEGDRWIGGIQRQLWAGIMSPLVSQKLVAFVAKEQARDLLEMNELVAAEKVTPVLGPTFPLSDGAAAITAFEKGDTKGRIVIST